MWTKRQIIEQALDEIGIADYQFDVQPEEQIRALKRLDAMMAQWESMGVRVGYNLPTNPDNSDPDKDSGLPDQVVEAVFINLGVRIAPSFGKTVSADTKAIASAAYQSLMNRSVQVPEMQYPSTLPRGQGNRRLWGRPTFFPRPDDDPLRIAQGGDLNVLPE
jgi:hypothetical protein